MIVLILALGIGATTGIFSLFYQILLEPLPVPAPERLVNLRESGPKDGFLWCGYGGVCDLENAFSYRMFRDLEAQQQVFTGIAAYSGGYDANLAYKGESFAATYMLVSGSYFNVLDLRPAVGRLIGPQDEPRAGESAVTVLSHDYWRSHFGSAANVVGRTLTVNGKSFTIIGVAPAGFSGTSIGSRPEVFIPLSTRWLLQPEASQLGLGPENPLAYFVNLFARLNPGVSVDRADAAMTTVYRGILEAEASSASAVTQEQLRERRLEVDRGARGQSSFPATAAKPLTLLLAITALVLLIVCVNVASLMYASGASRRGEMAIRASVGATRTRLITQLLTELGVLTVIGLVACLPVSTITLGAIVAILPEQLAATLAIELNASAAATAASISVATLFLFGLFPALKITRTDLGVAMKGRTAQALGARDATRFRSLLTAAQIAISTVLLVLAGLFVQSLANIGHLDLGMNVDSLVTFSIDPQLSGYDSEHVTAMRDEITRALEAQPGITSVVSASVPVLADKSSRNEIIMDGLENAPIDERLASSNRITPGFFGMFSIPFRAGRDFTAQEWRSEVPVAIVNESFVSKFGLGVDGDAIGKRFGVTFPERTDVEIIGVVADARYRAVKEDAPPQFFLPFRPESGGLVSAQYFYVLSDIDLDGLIRTIPRVVAGVAPDVPVNNPITVRRQVRDNIYVDRFIAVLSAAFAGLATLLTATGIYGAIAYGVALRTREFGLRLALGAAPSRLRRIVLGQVILVTLAGGSAGIAAAVGLGRAAQSLLFDLSGYDPAVIVAAVSVVAAVVFAASYPPARRASKIAPMEVLRYE